jgi:hypothetical protein
VAPLQVLEFYFRERDIIFVGDYEKTLSANMGHLLW